MNINGVSCYGFILKIEFIKEIITTITLNPTNTIVVNKISCELFVNTHAILFRRENVESFKDVTFRYPINIQNVSQILRFQINFDDNEV